MEPAGRGRVERRLAAILAADVAGYSRLIGADEEGTLEHQKALRNELVDPRIAEHKGRLVKTTGDGLLVEFASVVDALRCTAEIQAALAERNAPLPTDRRIEFRIGIHQGDVVVEDGDIFGDGVNIAARLEGLAEPGGICVSARVREDAAGKIELAFSDLGEQQLKNIERPVRAYAVGDAASPTRTQPPPNRYTLACCCGHYSRRCRDRGHGVVDLVSLQRTRNNSPSTSNCKPTGRHRGKPGAAAIDRRVAVRKPQQ
jgi:adenylate cyclase